MILNQVQRDVKTTGMQNSSRMQLSASEEVQDHIIKLLTENGYKRPIPSLIRELFCNGLDGSTANNTPDNPVLVSLYRDETGNWIFEVRDEGIGMSEADFYKYCMNIGESTKRSSNNMIGAMGAGFKSPLAYCEGFETITRKAGIENKFYIYKGTSRPEVTKIWEKETTDVSGVTVRVPVDRWDVSQFKEAIKEQLAYFPTAVIQIEGDSFDYLKSKVFRHELFEWSEMYPHNEMHISFAGVNYPLDWTALGISKIDIPIAVKIGLNENVCPIFNRESLIYTSETKKLLLSRINQIADYFVAKFNEANTELSTAKEIYDFVRSWKKYVTIAEHEFEINDIVAHRTEGNDLVLPKLKDINYLSSKQIADLCTDVLDEYLGTATITQGRFTTKEAHKKDILDELHKNRFAKIIVVDTELRGQLKEYLKDTYKSVLFVRKYRTRKLGKYSLTSRNLRDTSYKNTYVSMLSLYERPKQDWRAVITDYQSIVSYYENQMLPLSSIEIPEDWKLSKKKQREYRTKVRQSEGKQVRLKGQINFKFAERLEKWSADFSCKFVPQLLELQDFHKNKFLTVYGNENQRQILDQLYVINKGSYEKIKIAMLAQRDYEKLSTVNIHNLMTIEKFTSEKNKIIARYVTAYKADQVFRKYPILRDNIDYIETYISSDLGKLLQDINQYRAKYSNADNDLMKTLIQFCDTNKYYDYEIYPLIQEFEKQAPKLDFLQFLRKAGWSSSSIQPGKDVVYFIQETLRNRKFRMDWKHYVKPEELQSEQLT